MNNVVSRILNEKWEAFHPSLTMDHFGRVLRFRSGKEMIAVHHHIGFQDSRFYIGFPGNETPITEEEFRTLETYAISFCQEKRC